MIFHFGNFTIDVDVEQTRNYYRETSRTLTEGCDCMECRNFVKAYEGFDPRIRDFFESLGVDICKAPDMTAYHGDVEKNTLHYEGFCHLCGTILGGESAWVPGSDGRITWDEARAFAVTETCHVSFQERCYLLEADFPKPVIQMDVEICVPWVLENVQHDWMV